MSLVVWSYLKRTGWPKRLIKCRFSISIEEPKFKGFIKLILKDKITKNKNSLRKKILFALFPQGESQKKEQNINIILKINLKLIDLV